MAGRIRDEDVALVREKAAIDDIIRDLDQALGQAARLAA